MKRLLFLLGVLLHFATIKSQSVDKVFISTDFNSSCVITSPNERSKYEPHDFTPECFVVCQNSTVVYTAECSNAATYQWEVTGDAGHTVSYSGDELTVSWGTTTDGYIKVTVVTTSGITCSDERCISVINKPHISAMSLPGYAVVANRKYISVCLGETVSFTDDSDNSEVPITGYSWECNGSDNDFVESSATENFSFIPPAAGTYIVTHNIQNACGCTNSEKYIVKVTENEELHLSCYGTVCGGSKVSYRLENPQCSTYLWNVENGTISSGQGTSTITVEWEHPDEGYGILSIDAAPCISSCSNMISKKIPVISANVIIDGPEEVCVGELVRYELPLWGSTSYTWSAGSSNANVEIINYQYPNQKIFTFSQPGTYTIECEYYCEFLRCGSTSTKTIRVKESLSIESNSHVVCQSTPTLFSTNSGGTPQWKVYKNDGTLLHTATSHSLTYSFNSIDSYYITAYDSSYCNTARYIVSVRNNPVAPDTVYGFDKACPNESVLLSSEPLDSRYYIEWQTLPDSTLWSSNEIVVNPIFNGGVYNVNVFQVDREHGCRSDARVHTITPFVLSPLPSEDLYLCPETYTTIAVADQSPRVAYKWFLDEDSAFYASVQGNHLTNAITLATNRLVLNGEQYYRFPLYLERQGCSKVVETINVHINDNVVFSIDSTYACEDNAVSLSVTGPTSAHYSWNIENTNYTGRTVTHHFLNSGQQTYSVKGSWGPKCKASSQQTANITVYPKPDIDLIYDGVNMMHCAVSSTNVSYKWFYKGEFIDNASDIYVEHTDDLPNYCCEVYDNTLGCSAIKCYEPECNDGGEIETVDKNYCTGVWSFNVGGRDANEFEWHVEPNAAIELSGSEAYITFGEAGEYTVEAKEILKNECIIHRIDVTINFVPRFKLEYICNDKIKIIDESSYHNCSRNSPITFRSGNTVMGTMPVGDNTCQFAISTITSSTLINYDYSMSVTEIGMCTGTTNSIVVYPKGVITSFNVPSTTCSETPFNVSASGNNLDMSTFEWNFGDNSMFSDDSVDHTYVYDHVKDLYHITVTVKDLNKCSIENSKNIRVYDNPILEGSISAQNTPCPGGTCLLTLVNSSRFDYSYLWLDAPGNNIGSTYNATEVGSYILEISELTRGCRVHALGKSRFKTAPDAHIIAKTKYCPEDDIKLIGRTSPDNQYEWSFSGEGASDLDTNQYIPGNIEIGNCVENNNYYSQLVVTNSVGCSDTATHSFMVLSSPQAPTIAIDGTNCMNNLPIKVKSAQNKPLYWSNGAYSRQTNFFSPGYVFAHCYDTNGCQSQRSSVLLNYPPNYDALLTGCYCLANNRFAASQNLYDFFPQGSVPIRWQWYQDNNQISIGTTASPTLPIASEGTYYMSTSVPGDSNCIYQSPLLEVMKCDRTVGAGSEEEFEMLNYLNMVARDMKTTCYVENCKLYIRVEFRLENREGFPVVVNTIHSSSGSNRIVYCNPNPLTIPAGGYQNVELRLQVNNFNVNTLNVTFVDETNMGFYAIYNIRWDEFDCVRDTCTEDVTRLKLVLNETLTTNGQTIYFDFGLRYNNADGIYHCWSEPAQIISYTISDNTVNGLLQLNYGVISSMLDKDAESMVCIHAVTCNDSNDYLCHSVYCMPIYMLLNMADDNVQNSPPQPHNENTDTATVGSITPYLVPNPANEKVMVEGIDKDDITEIKIMDMHGKPMDAKIESNIITVSSLTDGAYIVSVQLKDKTIHYLKLIKK